MKRLHKTKHLGVRLTAEQERQLARAAKIESDRRGEIVRASELLREIAFLGIEQILAKHEAAA
jgi:uncharacterized protein (DUF1778 family)